MVIILFLLIGCGRNNQRVIPDEEFKNTQEAMVEVNRRLVKADQERIESFVKRKGWDMHESGSGLWYQIYEKGTGDSARSNMLITMDYKISLLDGTICYSSDSLGPKQFRIGSGGVESGLEEGVLMLHEGDRARFIMPPHLAYGLTGDGDKIPPRSIIIYDVKVLRLDGDTGADQRQFKHPEKGTLISEIFDTA